MNRQDQAGFGCTTAHEPCADFPALVRMNYFHGQLISERDLKAEQTYFRERLRHMNRCLHGFGIICGLGVSAVDAPRDCLDENDPNVEALRGKIAEIDRRLAEIKSAMITAGDDERKKLEEEYRQISGEREAILREIEKLGQPADQPVTPDCHCSEDKPPLHRVTIDCGAGLDCNGDDIILRRPVELDLGTLLDNAGKRQLEAGETFSVWLSICHVECGIEPARPYALDNCATHNRCVDSRVREDVRFTLSRQAPKGDQCCDGCCGSCEDECLLLAEIVLRPGRPIAEDDIDLSGRRPIGLYHPVTITGVSWHHGATYDAATVNKILGTREPDGGLVIRFSREVQVSTLLPGVIDIFRITGGRGVAALITAVDGEFVDLPADGFVREVRYRDTSKETVQQSDRVVVIVRGGFILDRCCHPVASSHVGGRVPALPDAPDPVSAPDQQSVCRYPPHGRAPWTTGPGAVFESWFYVAEE